MPDGHETEKMDCVVYVVDDDASMREALDSLLRSAGWQVQVFASAAEFLAAPRAALPACIVLDVSMPGDSGLDLQRSLNELGDRTPVIFMTAHGDIEMSVQAMKAGDVNVVLGREAQAGKFPRDAPSDRLGRARDPRLWRQCAGGRNGGIGLRRKRHHFEASQLVHKTRCKACASAPCP